MDRTRAAIRRAGSVATIVLAVSACGSTPTVGTPVSLAHGAISNQACQAMTRDDVTAVVGTDLGDGHLTPSADTTAPLGRCDYIRAAAGTQTAMTVSLTSWPVGLFRADAPGDSPAPGVGDQAWFAPQVSGEGIGVQVLYMARGSTLVMIEIDPQPAPQGQWEGMERALGLRVATKLS